MIFFRNPLVPTLFVLLLLVSSACDPKDKNVDFTIVATAAVAFEANYGIYLPVEFVPDSVTSDAESKFTANTTNAELLTAAKLTSVTLTLATPEGSTCDFLGELSVYIQAAGESEVLLAEAVEIREDGAVGVGLTPTQGDFVKYLNKDDISMRVVWTGDQFTVDEIVGSLKCDFAVSATKETK